MNKVENELKVVLFKSRNKDNKHLTGFKERSVSFVTTKTKGELEEDFLDFANKGLDGEVSRFYRSVNSRDNEKVMKALMHFLIDNDGFNMARLPQKVASLAAQKVNRKENKWLFDFDECESKLDGFLGDIYEHVEKENVSTHKTPNGHAIIVNHGFDTRELLDKWDKVELKRDDLLCESWMTHSGEVGLD